MDTNMSNLVFVCYSRKDEDFVLKLATNIKHQGVPVWLDQWDIPSGANWSRTIEKALKECSHVLLVLSPSSMESVEVEAEWRTALNDKKTIVPVLHKSCDIPYRLNLYQRIDFTSRSPDDETNLKKIFKDLGVAGSTSVKPVTQSKPIDKPRTQTKPSDIPVTQSKPIDKPRTQIMASDIFRNWYLLHPKISAGLFLILIIATLSYNLALNPHTSINNPENATYWYNKGLVLYEKSNYSGAAQAYDKATKINPENATYWYNKGLALEYQNKHDQAIEALDVAIKLNPDYADAWDSKGFALNALGDTTGSREDINRAIKIRLGT
jgi:tetratricopeptide (TPR) repeat protein